MAANALLRRSLVVLVALLSLCVLRGALAAPNITVVNAAAFYALWKGPMKVGSTPSTTSGNITFIDVRPNSLYRLSHIPGARSVPSEKAAKVAGKSGSKKQGVPPNMDIACYCTITETAQTACGEFAKLKAYAKVRIYVLQNGFATWVTAGYPTATGKGREGKGGKAGR